MRTALASLSLFIVACTTSNPWFVVDDGQDARTSTGATSMSGTSSSASDGTGIEPTTGRPTDTSATSDTAADTTAVTSTTDASATTQAIDTSTSGSSSAGDSSSDGTTAASNTGGTTDGTTGDPPIEPYYLLYPLCVAKETEWLGGAQADTVLECKANNKPPEAFQQPKVQGLLGSTLEDVLELAPSLEPAGAVVGTFGPFTLVGGEQGDAQFFTGLTCASSEAVGSCNANASAWVVFNGNELMTTSKALKNGLATSITIPLKDIPGVNSGEPFQLVLRADVGDAAHIEDRVWFIKPRIRPPGG